MTRARSQTIGTLGRAPARTSKPIDPLPPPPPVPDRGWLRRWLRGALLENTGLKFLSLVLAVTVFLLVNTDKQREITVRVGVYYDYPTDKVIDSPVLDEVRVTLRGRSRRLRDFDERQLDRIRLDLRNAPTGDIAIGKDLVTSVPPGLEVVSISPPAIRVAFVRRVDKVVEILPTIHGRAMYGYVLDEFKAAPATVTISGGERSLANVTAIRTTEVDVEGKYEPFEAVVGLIAPDGVTIERSQPVNVAVRFKVELVTRTLGAVPVFVGEGPERAKWLVTPPSVDITLTGPLLDVEDARRNLVARAVPDPRNREVKVVVDRVKEGVGVRIAPERVVVSPK